MRRTLQSRIAVTMWAMTIISTVASAVLTGTLLIASHRESIRQQLQATATSLVTLGITHFSELKDFEELNRFVEDALQIDRVDKIIRVYDESRKLIFTTAGTDYDTLPEKLSETIKKPVFLTIEGTQRRYESLVMSYVGVGNKKTFYLQVAIPLLKYSEMLESLWWQSILLLGFLITISVILSHWLSIRLSRPVRIIANHLQKIDPAKIDEWKPINLDNKSLYLKAIADGINLLAERMRVAILQLKKMSRYVAHEMRTPLTILRGEAEMMLLRKDATVRDYENVLRSSLEEIERMSDIVNTVLRVGEDAQIAPFFKPFSFDLVEWIIENRAEWEKTLDRQIDLNIPISKQVIVRADPKLLFRLVDNLVRNVKNHTPRETICTISIKFDDNDTILVVSDNGPGLSEEKINSLNTLQKSSDAAGIGLNLCYRIAEISGMELIFASTENTGLSVQINM